MSDRTDNDHFAKVLFGHTDAGHALPWEQLPDGKRNYYREGARAVLAAARKEKPPIESALNRAKLEGKIEALEWVYIRLDRITERETRALIRDQLDRLRAELEKEQQ